MIHTRHKFVGLSGAGISDDVGDKMGCRLTFHSCSNDDLKLIPISKELPLSEAAETRAAAEKSGIGKISLALCIFTQLATTKRKTAMKNNLPGIDIGSKPSGEGCVECLASPDGWWFHLRRCAECGHIGCCDSSPSQHASKHAAVTGHSIITSFEPGENWFYDYKTGEIMEGVKLPPPHAHPNSQPTPGPAGRVPADWESLLN